MNQRTIQELHDILPQDVTVRFFDLLKSNIQRTKASMSIVVIKMLATDVEERLNVHHFLLSKIRKNDTLFHMNEKGYIGILLTQSGEREAIAFLRRLFEQSQHEKAGTRGVIAHITEIRHLEAELVNVLDEAVAYLQTTEEPWHIQLNTMYKQPVKELVKVSVIESNPIFRDVLHAEVERLQLTNFTLETRIFEDGYDFLQSDFYVSAHTHLVIVNDLLPRKNGVAVLHQLRSMPNEKKFIIYMMTSRFSENDMISAYKAGVDQYLVKPFNLRLFEAQIERSFERLWS